MNAQINTHTLIMEYGSTIKRNEIGIGICATEKMNLENVLGKRGQTQKVTWYNCIFMKYLE